jgi:CPA1 family monovalent cation:H+ antiporter
VSPPDAAAATAICQRLGVSRRIVTVLEGESLVNDASGLIAYRVAIVAITVGAFSPLETAWSFFIASGGGIAVGLVAGIIIAQLHKRVRDPMVTTALSLLAPFAAYLPAEAFHVSGVLSTVAAGLYVSRRSPQIFSPTARIQAVHVWELAMLLINGVVFVLIGLQLDDVIEAVKHEYTLGQLAWYATAVSLAVIAIRLIWVFPVARLLQFAIAPWKRISLPDNRQMLVIGWTGMRGIVSLAAALAIPMFVMADERTKVSFEFRNLIVLLTFAVIFSTLVIQSLTLGPLIRWLGESVQEGGKHEDLIARMVVANAALTKLDTFAADGPDGAIITRVRAEYLERLEAATRQASGEEEGSSSGRSPVEESFRRMAIAEERTALIRLRDSGEVSEEVFRTIERELDLEETRLWNHTA